jgi:hypothetical protein
MTGLGIQSDTLSSLAGDYLVTTTGTNQSPAFRVYITDANGRTDELIWEAAYNGGYTAGTQDSLQSTDLFWRYITGQGFDGTSGVGSGSYVEHTLADWGDILGGTVIGIGIGQGGGAGTGFHAYADNLALNTTQGSFSYDFQAPAAVPEPATWAMMLFGFGGVGFQLRRKRSALVAQSA